MERILFPQYSIIGASKLPLGLVTVASRVRKKKVIGRENWRPYVRRFWTKAVKNRPKKIFYENHGFQH
jgi:hypothetical protein